MRKAQRLTCNERKTPAPQRPASGATNGVSSATTSRNQAASLPEGLASVQTGGNRRPITRRLPPVAEIRQSLESADLISN